MSLRFFRLCLAPGLVLAVTVGAQPPPASTPATAVQPAAQASNVSAGNSNPATMAAQGNDLMTIKLPDTDIDTMLNTLRELTGKVILRPAALPPASFNLMIERPMSKNDIILAIETELALNNIGVAPLGDKFLKVVPLQSVRTEAPELITTSTLELPPSGRIATKIFMLDFLRVNEFVQQIGGLLSIGTGGPQSVVQLPSANAALITDSISNLQRIEILLAQVDRPVTASIKPKFYTLHNGAKASDVVAKIRATIGQQLQLQLGNATTYSADDRSNQIILIADPRQHPFFDELIDKLDVKSDPSTRNEVIPLKHAIAKEVALILINLVQGQTAAAAKASQSVRPGQGAQGNPGSGGNNGLLNPVTSPGILPPGVVGPPQPAVAQAPTTAAINAAGSSIEGNAGTNEFSVLVSIQSDDRSNAIVVSGTVDDLRLIRSLVDKLDVLLSQVRIEVIIAEVTLTNTDKSGISALNLTVGTDTPASGDNGRGTHITNFDTAGGDLGGWAITSGVVNPLAFQAALTNNGSKNNVKILSAPTIVTTHNQEAEIVVGQQQPIITGTQSTVAGTGTTPVSSSTVSYKDIALDLKVTPLIGDDGSIQLKIDQKVDDVIDNVIIDGNQQPIIGHRQATSFINVYDSQMIVLGGLQRNNTTYTRNKIGFIYEIPILSNLLGARSHTTTRTELLLFIRPHVLKPENGTADTQKSIDALPNKDQINQFLKDPSKAPSEKLIDEFK